jgi:hypothetical protein
VRGLTGGQPTAGRADWDLEPPVRSALPALAALLGQRGGSPAFRRTVPGCGLEHAQSEPVVVVAVDRSFEFRHVTYLDGLDQLPVHLDILGPGQRVLGRGGFGILPDLGIGPLGACSDCGNALSR